MPDWAALALKELPTASGAEPGVTWYALQHAFGLTAFGANAFVASASGDVLVEEHDETGSGQEELYVVVSGAAEFVLDGDAVRAPSLFAVGVRPAVTRSAVALDAATTLLVFGGVPNDEFRSTWWDEHFEGVPRLLDRAQREAAGPGRRSSTTSVIEAGRPLEQGVYLGSREALR